MSRSSSHSRRRRRWSCTRDRKSTRLNSSHEWISYAVFCLKKKKKRKELHELEGRSCPVKLSNAEFEAVTGKTRDKPLDNLYNKSVQYTTSEERERNAADWH